MDLIDGEQKKNKNVLLNCLQDCCNKLIFWEDNNSNKKKFQYSWSQFENLPDNIFEILIEDVNGQQHLLKNYLGKEAKCIIIANVMPYDYLNKKYLDQLQKLYEKYYDKGLRILAFPTDQFIVQKNKEAGFGWSGKKIEQFLKENHSITFDVLNKVFVKGPQIHQLFLYLIKNSNLYEEDQMGSFNVYDINYNLCRFLINQEGKVEYFYGPEKQPKIMEERIQMILGLKPYQKIESEVQKKMSKEDIKAFGNQLRKIFYPEDFQEENVSLRKENNLK